MYTPVLFKHPLNKKMHTWLRIEFLIQQMAFHPIITIRADAPHFFRNVGNLSDVLERSKVYIDLVKELERQQCKLQSWAEVSGVDQECINKLRQQLKQPSSTLIAAPRIGQFLREDRLIVLARQRLSIPGSCYGFDLPTLHIWLHALQVHRGEQMVSWLASLDPLIQSLNLILDLIRSSALFRKQISLNGFYQDNGGGADPLRLHLDLAHQLYLQISGHKSRFVIRFLPLDSECGIVPERFDLELACC